MSRVKQARRETGGLVFYLFIRSAGLHRPDKAEDIL